MSAQTDVVALAARRFPANGRTGETDHERIEELRHLGLRPKDARRVEELERTLGLPEEQPELDRVRAAALCRAEPDVRNRCIAQAVHDVRKGEITPYGALKRLQALEIADQSLNFARYKATGAGRFELICYKPGGCPGALFKLVDWGGAFEGEVYTGEGTLKRYDKLPT